MDKGNTHTTFITNWNGVKCIGQKLAFVPYKIPSMDFSNKLSEHLKNDGIITPRILRQDKEYRIMEFLEGTFKDFFTKDEQVQAINFLKKLHSSLRKFESTLPSYNFIKLVGLPNVQTIWGDTKANNFLWSNNEIIGLVDYDTVCKNDIRFDVTQAVISWQPAFTYERAKELISLYGGLSDMDEIMRRFLLIHHKMFSNHVLFQSYSKVHTKEYWLDRIHHINMIYDEIAEKTL